MNFAYLALCKEGRLPDYSFHKGHVFRHHKVYFSDVGGAGYECNHENYVNYFSQTLDALQILSEHGI